MSSVLSDALKRVYPRHRTQLVNDSRAFADACIATGESEAAGADAGRASPDMIAALMQWNQDAQVALAAIQGLSDRVSGKALAVQTLQALVTALGLLGDSLSITDPTQAQQAAVSAAQQLDAYHQLVQGLDRRFP